jgi:hypothetical protein
MENLVVVDEVTSQCGSGRCYVGTIRGSVLCNYSVWGVIVYIWLGIRKIYCTKQTFFV